MSDEEKIVQSATSFDDEAQKRIVNQAFELWINPEIERRANAGLLQVPVELYMAQVVWPDDKSISVRLNEEVKGVAWTRMGRPIEKGDPVLVSDLSGFAGFELEDDELDFAHMTLMFNGHGWAVSFNFLRKRARAQALLEKADQFLVAAKDAFGRNHSAVVVENLYGACELSSKADLLTSMMVDDDTNHRAIHSAINQQGKLGNVDGAFVSLFNRLSRLRPFFRYASATSEDLPVSQDDLDLAHAFIDGTRSKVRRLQKDDLEGDPLVNVIRISQ